MKKKINIEEYNKFLIVQTAFLGDVAISLELVEAIKHFHPNADIDFITTPQSAEIIELSNYVRNVYPFDKKNIHRRLSATKLFAKEINREHYDCVISLHKSFRTSLLVSKLDAKIKIGFQDSVFSSLVYDYRVKSNFSLSEHYRVLIPLSTFGIKYLDYQVGNYSITLPADVKSKIEQLLNDYNIGKKFIVLTPGSVWNTKKWGREKYSELAKMLENDGLPIVLVGGKDDIEDCYYIENSAKVVNFAGKTTIIELMYLINKASLVISNDSAPVHFANVVKTPVIAIFGPTSPFFGFAPIGSNDSIIENTTLKCRPCQIHGSRKCPLNTMECMTSIKTEDVYQIAINKIHNL